MQGVHVENLDEVVFWVSSGVCVCFWQSPEGVACDACPRSRLMKDTRKDIAIWCLSFSGLCRYCLSVCVCVCVCVCAMRMHLFVRFNM